jgi:hypothetical protein
MTTLIKLFYAGAITALLILIVAFGIRTVDAPPEAPVFPQTPVGFRPVAPKLPNEPEPVLTPEQREYEENQRRFQEELRVYEEDLEDYHRNVFLAASVIGVLAVAGGIVLSSRIDAIRLGLVAGGLGTLLYGVIQAGSDLSEIGSEVMFGVALVGFVLVLAAGYRWLAATNEPA